MNNVVHYIYNLWDMMMTAFADFAQSATQPLLPPFVVDFLDTLDTVTSIFPNMSAYSLLRNVFEFESWSEFTAIHFFTAGLVGTVVFMIVKWFVGLIT